MKLRKLIWQKKFIKLKFRVKYLKFWCSYVALRFSFFFLLNELGRSRLFFIFTIFPVTVVLFPIFFVLFYVIFFIYVVFFCVFCSSYFFCRKKIMLKGECYSKVNYRFNKGIKYVLGEWDVYRIKEIPSMLFCKTLLYRRGWGV